jgi:hypothetical protein
MGNANRILIHTGYVKTGSTWLQTQIFKNEALGFALVCDRSFSTHQIIYPPFFEFNIDVIQQHINEKLRHINDDKVPVVSHERLAGSAISGGFDSGIIAERLLKLFPRAKILIVIREQVSHILSTYKEYVNQGGTCSLKKFLFPPKGRALPLFSFAFYEFHKLIEHYHSLWGRENILVLPFELLVQRPLDFYNSIATFVGAMNVSSIPCDRVRISKDSLAVSVERRLNRLFYRSNVNPSASFNIPKIKRIVRLIDRSTPSWLNRLTKIDIQKEIPPDIMKRYAVSNTITSSYTDFQLSDFGYYL